MTNFLGGSHYVYNWVYGLRRSPTWKHCPFGSIRYLPSYSAITWNDSWNFGLHFQRLDQRTSHQRLSGIYRTLQRWSWSTKSHRLDSRRMGKILYLHLENVARFFHHLPISTQLQCCGIEGPQDWDKNVYFNCSSASVGSREACGVPFSCCKFNK